MIFNLTIIHKDIMKKNLLMVALVVSAISMANVKGTFKLNTESNAKHKTTYAVAGSTTTLDSSKFTDMVEKTTNSLKAESELKFGDSGFTLGSSVKLSYNHKPEKFGDKYFASTFDINGKYDVKTNVEGLKAFLKLGGTIDLNSLKTTEKDNTGKYMENKPEQVAELKDGEKLYSEAGISYKVKDITFGFTNKTNVKLNKTDFSSTEELKISGKHGKLSNILLRAELGHGYESKFHKAEAAQGQVAAKKAYLELKSPMYIQGELKLEGNLGEKTKLEVRDLITYSIHHELTKKQKKVKSEILGEFEHEIFGTSNLASAKLTHSHDDYTVAGTFMFDFNNILKAPGSKSDGSNAGKTPELETLLGYGFKLEGKYTGIKGLTLSADALLMGKKTVETKSAEIPVGQTKPTTPAVVTTKDGSGTIKFNAEAKYDFNATDKLTLTPKGKVSANIFDITEDGFNKFELVLTPSLEAKVSASKNVTLTSSLETPVKFDFDKVKAGKNGNTDKNLEHFAYRGTDFKAKLGLEYKF